MALALCLFALLVLLPPVAGHAQERDKTPAPDRLWRAFPLDPRASPSAQPVATSSPAHARSDPVAASRPDGGSGAPVILLGLLALLAAGGAVTFLQIRRRHEHEHEPSAVALAPGLVRPAGGRSGRFARATAGPSGARTLETIATVASAPGPGRGAPREGGEAPAPAAAAKVARGNPSPLAPIAPSAALVPPDRTSAWTAEIEWRHSDRGSRFCVIARGAGTTTLTQSPPLEWPPVGTAAVQAMSDAPEKLAGALLAAGWKALPPGSAWYAKRFAWEPVRAERPAATVEATAADGQSDAAGASRLLRQPALRIALLCVLVALGPLAALLLNGGDDQAPAPKPKPKPTPSAKAAKPAGSDGIDLTIPIIVVVGGVGIVLAIRRTQRQRR